MKTDTIALSIDMCLESGSLEQAIQLLVSVGGRIEVKTGCLSRSVARDAVHSDRIHYRESWNSETAFQNHLRSPEFRCVLVAMDMCREEPEVVIGSLSGFQGLIYLQQLCDRHGAGEAENL